MRRVIWLLLALLLVPGWPRLLRAAEERSPITISSDSLEVNRKDRVAVYKGDVVAIDKGRGLTILANQIEFYFDGKMQEVERAVATGNVRLSYGDRRGTAEKAEYFPADNRAVLLGHPRVWQDTDVVTGCRITLLMREDRSQVDACAGERVNAILYPRQGQAPQAPQVPQRGAAPQK